MPAAEPVPDLSIKEKDYLRLGYAIILQVYIWAPQTSSEASNGATAWLERFPIVRNRPTPPPDHPTPVS